MKLSTTNVGQALSKIFRRDAALTAVQLCENLGGGVNASICDVRGDRPAMVTIISDDGVYASGVLLNELARSHGLRVTSACTVGNAKKELDGWRAIVKEGYVDIVNHSYTHLRIDDKANASKARLIHEVVDSKEYLEKAFGGNQICFVPPENATTTEEVSLIEQNYYAMRRGTRGLNPLAPEWGDKPFQWLNLAIRGSHDVESVEGRNSWVDEAIQNRSWLIEMWHNVYDAEPYGFQPMSKHDADKHMEYVASKVKEGSCWCASFMEATKYLHEKAHSLVHAEVKGSRIAVSVNYEDDFLPPHIFNFPLTVRISVPSMCSRVKVRIGRRNTWATVKNTPSGKAILVDIVPEKETALITCY